MSAGSATGSAGVPPAPDSSVPDSRPDAGAPCPEWHSRGYLPHRDKTGLIQALTFRLADSLPADALARIESELIHTPVAERDVVRAQRLAAWLDQSHGACELARPEIATLVENALLHFGGERYRLIAWCVMPNHVHALVEPAAGHSLVSIVQNWKSFTAKAANRLLGRTGEFWMREYHDRYIRDAAHFAAAIRYIEENPVNLETVVGRRSIAQDVESDGARGIPRCTRRVHRAGDAGGRRPTGCARRPDPTAVSRVKAGLVATSREWRFGSARRHAATRNVSVSPASNLP